MLFFKREGQSADFWNKEPRDAADLSRHVYPAQSRVRVSFAGVWSGDVRCMARYPHPARQFREHGHVWSTRQSFTTPGVSTPVCTSIMNVRRYHALHEVHPATCCYFCISNTPKKTLKEMTRASLPLAFRNDVRHRLAGQPWPNDGRPRSSRPLLRKRNRHHGRRNK